MSDRVEMTASIAGGRSDGKQDFFYFYLQDAHKPDTGVYIESNKGYKHKSSARRAADQFAKRHNFFISNWED